CYVVIVATKGNRPVPPASPSASPRGTSQRTEERTESEHKPGRPADGFEAVRQKYPPILNTAQVAELLDLNARTVLNMAGDGRLPASRLPGSRKFHFLLEDIISTLKANRISPD
ncbi:MAG: helix-turn-helix domain-containing protein, partial [Acidimicrobiia bacterium]|nr:helix-turn-helix domain-containing protein [Acidimicrobiia bacterium]